MDWVVGVIHKLKKQWKRASLKQALIAYILCAIAGTAFLWLCTSFICDGWIDLIMGQTFGYNAKLMSEDTKGNVVVMIESTAVTLLWVKYGSIFVYSVIAIILTAHFFYRNKIIRPMTLLREEVIAISQNELGFDCSYESKDEMGELCTMFNQMRLKLIRSQKELWGMMEQQNQLNSALAHDLRTPLTVMQGYTDLILKYYPKGKMTEEKLLETMGIVQTQLIRMIDFTEMMKNLRDLNQRVVHPKEVGIIGLGEKLEHIIEGLRLSSKASITFQTHRSEQKGYLDEEVVLQVFDNLMSNALSFCKQKVDVVLETDLHSLRLFVRDDGCGFKEKELFIADRPYYCGREEKEPSKHLGMGLSICKLLCEKHKGSLTLSNSIEGGAIVCASFSNFVQDVEKE